MKPWSALTAVEKCEAIARRLGWTFDKVAYVRVSCDDYHQHREHCLEPCSKNSDGAQERHRYWRLGIKTRATLPDWPTNDGLAFAEVWSVIQRIKGPKFSTYPALSAIAEKFCVAYHHEGDTLNPQGYRAVLVSSNTWADAIRAAAYELLPEEPND